MSEYNNDHKDDLSNQYSNDEYSYSISGASGYENDDDHPTIKKKHTGLKGVLAILMLLIGAGAGFQFYRFMNTPPINVQDITHMDEETAIKSNAEVTEVPTPAQPSENQKTDDIPSLISIASRKDAKYLPDIVDEIMPSVVGVTSTFEYTRTYNTWGWGGFRTETETQNPVGTGTGIIMTDDGYIITNAHVIYDDSEYKCGEAIDVSVLFSDETEHAAKIISYDIETDIAVLKVDETGLTPAEFGDSEDLRVGELVIAVGNPLGFELYGSVTSGIVSALNRQISINDRDMTLIQTDAAINNGNSGGPLLNSCGQVIGINSAKLSSSYGSNQATIEGLGFAIPINNAKTIIDDLINYNHVTGRPQIGITSRNVTEAYSRYFNLPMGVYVQSVSEGSAAEKAGLKIGDVIIGIEGQPITTNAELNKIRDKYKAGDEITLTIARAGEDIDLKIILQDAAENQNTTLNDDIFNSDNEASEN